MERTSNSRSAQLKKPQRTSVDTVVPTRVTLNPQLCPVSKEEIEVCSDDCNCRKSIPCDEDVFEMCSIFIAENNFAFPSTADEAVAL